MTETSVAVNGENVDPGTEESDDRVDELAERTLSLIEACRPRWVSLVASALADAYGNGDTRGGLSVSFIACDGHRSLRSVDAIEIAVWAVDVLVPTVVANVLEHVAGALDELEAQEEADEVREEDEP